MRLQAIHFRPEKSDPVLEIATNALHHAVDRAGGVVADDTRRLGGILCLLQRAEARYEGLN
ncbi:hypothetical protein D9M68_898050 [compost metagenome]